QGRGPEHHLRLQIEEEGLGPDPVLPPEREESVVREEDGAMRKGVGGGEGALVHPLLLPALHPQDRGLGDGIGVATEVVVLPLAPGVEVEQVGGEGGVQNRGAGHSHDQNLEGGETAPLQKEEGGGVPEVEVGAVEDALALDPKDQEVPSVTIIAHHLPSLRRSLDRNAKSKSSSSPDFRKGAKIPLMGQAPKEKETENGAASATTATSGSEALVPRKEPSPPPPPPGLVVAVEVVKGERSTSSESLSDEDSDSDEDDRRSSSQRDGFDSSQNCPKGKSGLSSASKEMDFGTSSSTGGGNGVVQRGYGAKCKAPYQKHLGPTKEAEKQRQEKQFQEDEREESLRELTISIVERERERRHRDREVGRSSSSSSGRGGGGSSRSRSRSRSNSPSPSTETVGERRRSRSGSRSPPYRF
ncbi:hypothetical protein Ocin01_13378, partial [Orchesella cincta]